MAASISVSASSVSPAGSSPVRMQRLGEPARHLGAAVLFALDAQFRQHQPHHFFQQLGVAPEDVKGLVEDQPLVRPVDEDGVQASSRSRAGR